MLVGAVLFLLLACAYTVDDYWSDLTKAHCKCEQEQPWRDCQDDWMAVYEEGPYAACAENPSPVPRAEVKEWVKDYTENCIDPDEPFPEPEDPEWYESCG